MRTVNLACRVETGSKGAGVLFKKFGSRIKWAHAHRYDHYMLSVLRRRIHTEMG